MAALTDLLISALLAHSIAACVLAFVPAHNATVRIAAVAAIAAICVQAVRRADEGTDEGQSYAEYMIGFMLHANCFLVLMRLGPPAGWKSRRDRLWWAIVALFTPRRTLDLRTRRMERKATFLVRRALLLTGAGVTYIWLQHNTLSPYPASLSDYAPAKDSLVLQLVRHQKMTTHDLSVRAESAFRSLAMPSFLLLALHSLCSIIAVSFGCSSPQEWPQLYGSPLQAYNLRRFYQKFWHQLMRKAFTMNAAAITRTVLRLKSHSMVGRSCVVILCFLMSGLMHTASGWLDGPCGSWRPLLVCLATGVAILLEQALQAGYAGLHKRFAIRWSTLEMIFWRLVGYCWVAAWWLEVLPWSIYPATRCYVRYLAY